MTAPNIYERRARLEKTRKLIHATEAALARLGVTNFADPALADLIASWDAMLWTGLSVFAGVTICANAPRNHRVCAECIAAVVADFRERPALAAAIARMEG